MKKKNKIVFFILFTFFSCLAFAAKKVPNNIKTVDIDNKISGQYRMITVSKAFSMLLAGWRIRNESDVDLKRQVFTSFFSDRSRKEISNEILKPLELKVIFYSDLSLAIIVNK